MRGSINARFRERLPACDLAEAKSLLVRFLDPEVWALVLGYLHEFEAEGDPYSRDILAAWKE